MYEEKKKGTLKENVKKQPEGHKNNEGAKEGTQNDELKKLAQYHVSEALKSMLEEWKKEFDKKIEFEREDAAKLATMSSEERARLEMEKKQKDFESERAQYVSERAEFEAAKELAAQNLPVSFAQMVADSDKEQMTNKINILRAEDLKAIEEGLSQRLKGRAPKISGEKEQMSDPFLSGLGM